MLTQQSAAGFAGGDYVEAPFPEERGELFQLRGFADAIEAFKRDKFAAFFVRHVRDLTTSAAATQTDGGFARTLFSSQELLCDSETI